MYEKSSTFAIWKGYTAARGLKIEYVGVPGTLPTAVELKIPTLPFWSRKAQCRKFTSLESGIFSIYDLVVLD